MPFTVSSIVNGFFRTLWVAGLASEDGAAAFPLGRLSWETSWVKTTPPSTAITARQATTLAQVMGVPFLEGIVTSLPVPAQGDWCRRADPLRRGRPPFSPPAAPPSSFFPAPAPTARPRGRASPCCHEGAFAAVLGAMAEWS